ncbi:DUF6395 domain-containing protein [Psychrobacter celer]|uniref:DUF6395 domain-containing protein n=1 Tax=Psychrobacter celer TaxID=306572 RepID=UPI003FD240E1
MKVSVMSIDKVPTDLGIHGIRFYFELEEDDLAESVSTNAGSSKILLKERYCNFYLPLKISLPHPDLCAFAALKIISPYIGSSLKMDRAISKEMAEYIKGHYQNICNIDVDESLKPISHVTKDKAAISFSGGVDSVAAALLMGKEAPLIMTARTFHPEIGKFEQWNNPKAHIKTLQYMPYDFSKILVYTDFPYLSVNATGSFCVYPDSYAFTIPCVLLSEFLGIGNIITGDIMAAFTGNETIYNKRLTSAREEYLFKSIGINLDYPCNGVSEIITTKIVKDYGMLEMSSTCEYGDFMRPCMKCIKCFRKSIYKWALFDEALNEDQLKIFNESPAIIKFSEDESRKGLSLMPSYKFCFQIINYDFRGNLKKIYDRAMRYSEPVVWVDKKFGPAYISRNKILDEAIIKLNKYAPEMIEIESDIFKRLDWKVAYK